MNKKRLDVAAIQNELEGSVFFRKQQPLPPATPPVVKTPAPRQRKQTEPVPGVPPVLPVPLVPPVRGTPPTKRVMKQRHPFDIYQDQYETLQELSLEERKQGGIGSMSAMVRDGIDIVIAAKRNGVLPSSLLTELKKRKA